MSTPSICAALERRVNEQTRMIEALRESESKATIDAAGWRDAADESAAEVAKLRAQIARADAELARAAQAVKNAALGDEITMHAVPGGRRADELRTFDAARLEAAAAAEPEDVPGVIGGGSEPRTEAEHLHAAQVAAREYVVPHIRAAMQATDNAEARVAYAAIAEIVAGNLDPQIVSGARALIRFVEGGPPQSQRPTQEVAKVET